jgi:hypothetical protein
MASICTPSGVLKSYPTFVVERIQDDSHPVIAPRLVTIRVASADLRRIRIFRLEGEIDMALVVADQTDGANRRSDVLAGLHLVVQLDARGAFPRRLVEQAVDLDGGCGARHLMDDGRGGMGNGRHKDGQNTRSVAGGLHRILRNSSLGGRGGWWAVLTA